MSKAKKVVKKSLDITKDFFTGEAVKKLAKKGGDEIGNAVGTITGTREIEKAQKSEAKRLRELQAGQEQEDELTQRRRRNSLRATLSERPNLFDRLGTRQDGL